ncbi:sister chromatid cohesion 1 protein 1 [Humulus lupulus]|uniref:sister chromatid cohesion 1 protein 1 n=1 Tax=Humulus lupulus TaxID=3486 RepID=UPI002B40BC85|nr:sister chromatid cohesion 1 protein 1 [Humulus lupulus]
MPQLVFSNSTPVTGLLDNGQRKLYIEVTLSIDIPRESHPHLSHYSGIWRAPVKSQSLTTSSTTDLIELLKLLFSSPLRLLQLLLLLLHLFLSLENFSDKMFYSHQLLARKAALGQIWMAATMHCKIDRRKLHKIDLIKICDEILNPSVPMALRLSGILMGGVVIVYERKVKLLYDDVTRLLVEINQAWKVKDVPDRTLLPKGKSQAKKEAVTLPENKDTDVGDMEQIRNSFSATADMGFQQTAYFSMRLDSVDPTFINDNAGDQSEHFHQADPENITIFEKFDPNQADTTTYNLYERFDVEGDDEPQFNFTSGTQIHTTLIASPPLPDEPERAYEIHNPEPELYQNDESKEVNQVQQNQGPRRKKRGKLTVSIMDNEQTIVPGHVYQSWLQNPSDITLKRGRGRNRKRTGLVSNMKIAHLMELPPTVLMDDLFRTGIREVYYPRPLMEMWIKSGQIPQKSPSERASPAPSPEARVSLQPEEINFQDQMGFEFQDFHSGVGSPSLNPFERQRTDTVSLMDELRANLMKNGSGNTESNVMRTPGYSGDGVRSIPSSASGQTIILNNVEVNSGRSNKKRTYSSSRHSSNGLRPVAEENAWDNPDPSFKLQRLSEHNGLTPDNELLVETGPTQTPQPVNNHPFDKITDCISMQMKAHFDTPGAPQVESLNNLATGMNPKGAALLFYQTCVLASKDVLKVEQKVPYGDIFISKGRKM